MIDIFCETILPGDKALGMPSGATIDMKSFLAQVDVDALFTLLNDIAYDNHDADFSALHPDQRLGIVEQAKRKNMRLATNVIVQCLKAYYSNADVLRCLPAGAVPPFPDGNNLNEDDWAILEPVFERGEFFRKVKP